MKILFPVDTLSKSPTNPYLTQLIESLYGNEVVTCVSYGAELFFWNTINKWDIIHFQWPEALFGWNEPTYKKLALADAKMIEHKKYSKIVTTIHNHSPHPKFSLMGENVFDLVYRNTDVFIHLGKTSMNDFIIKYKHCNWFNNNSHYVIDHGDYAYYKKIEQDYTLVNEYKLKDSKIILVFGALRTPEEEALARLAFEIADINGLRLLFAGMPTKSAIPAEILSGKYDKKKKNIVRLHKRIPEEQVGPLIESANIMFLPRIGRLNSGTIPLAYTYGIPVIAPNEGVIKDMVLNGGGYLYEPNNIKSAADAILKAFNASYDEVAKLRRMAESYRTKYLLWSIVSKRHLEIYKSLKNSHKDSALKVNNNLFVKNKETDKKKLIKVCFTVALNGYEKKFESCILSQFRYSMRYGYKYYCITSMPWLMTPRQSAWSKVAIIRKMMQKNVDQVAFIDADCEVRPHAPKFEDLLNNAQMAMALGKSGRLNSGVMFINKSTDVIKYLDTIISNSDKPVPKEDRTAYENGHFIHYAKNVDFINKIDHLKWNNNSVLDPMSYVQHYSGGDLRRYWEEKMQEDKKTESQDISFLNLFDIREEKCDITKSLISEMILDICKYFDEKNIVF